MTRSVLHRLKRRLRHHYAVRAASLLPDKTLRWLHVHAPIDRDPSDGWTFWLDASYLRWCGNKPPNQQDYDDMNRLADQHGWP